MPKLGNGWHRRDNNSPASKARKAKYNSAEHRNARKHYAAWIATGNGRCWRCGRPITPGSDWHVGHDDLATNVIRGAEHAACNKTAAARKGNRIAMAKRKLVRSRVTRLTW